jgi:hypothetical protein
MVLYEFGLKQFAVVLTTFRSINQGVTNCKDIPANFCSEPYRSISLLLWKVDQAYG